MWLQEGTAQIFGHSFGCRVSTRDSLPFSYNSDPWYDLTSSDRLNASAIASYNATFYKQHVVWHNEDGSEFDPGYEISQYMCMCLMNITSMHTVLNWSIDPSVPVEEAFFALYDMTLTDFYTILSERNFELEAVLPDPLSVLNTEFDVRVVPP